MKTITKLTLYISTTAALVLVAGCASSGVQNPSGVPVTHMTADEQGFVAGTGIESVSVYSVTGTLVKSVSGENKGTLLIDMEGTTPGIYLVSVRLAGDGTGYVRRFVKK